VNRRQFLRDVSLLTAATLCSFDRTTVAQTASTKPTTAPAEDLVWHDVRDWGVEGRGFNDTESYFDRLPARAKGVVRDDVWNLSHHTAGMSVRFTADAPAIHVRYVVTNRELAMTHMPATGVSGLDLYVKRDDGWRWLATHHPREQSMTAELTHDVPPGANAYAINLPLYNGVKSFEIGIPKSAATTFVPVARRAKPLLFYGTSITQGGCASRPGMAFVSILGRRLDRPVLNFGFSGNGRTEIEVARFLAELDPAVFVIDCVANTTAEDIAARTGPLVKLLRHAHERTPILLVEDRTWANAAHVPRLQEYHREKRAALRRVYESIADDVGRLYYHPGDDLLGHDGEATVDGSHPSDLGMMRYADALEPQLRKLIAES
jgi:lysophospholipase L1-like esterase